MRFIPKDPRVQIAEGWCVKTPKLTPVNCSWCSIPFAFVNGIATCRVCDKPHAGGLRVVDLDKELGGNE
jgi:hypothetical protein